MGRFRFAPMVALVAACTPFGTEAVAPPPTADGGTILEGGADGAAPIPDVLMPGPLLPPCVYEVTFDGGGSPLSWEKAVAGMGIVNFGQRENGLTFLRTKSVMTKQSSDFSSAIVRHVVTKRPLDVEVEARFAPSANPAGFAQLINVYCDGGKAMSMTLGLYNGGAYLNADIGGADHIEGVKAPLPGTFTKYRLMVQGDVVRLSFDATTQTTNAGTEVNGTTCTVELGPQAKGDVPALQADFLRYCER